MEKGYFITGMDTNTGKTWATIALMRYFKQQGKTVVGMKPVASGCSKQDGQLKNEDTLLITALSVPLLGALPHLASVDFDLLAGIS